MKSTLFKIFFIFIFIFIESCNNPNPNFVDGQNDDGDVIVDVPRTADDVRNDFQNLDDLTHKEMEYRGQQIDPTWSGLHQ